MNSSDQYQSYVPVYDVIPEQWEGARAMLAEALKLISNAVNIRQIGWLLDEEYLNGQAFIPGIVNPNQFRSVLMKVVDMGTIGPGASNVPHGITVDANFTLMNLYVSATNSAIPIATVYTGDLATVSIDAVNINVNTGAGVFDRAYAFVTYIQEL